MGITAMTAMSWLNSGVQNPAGPFVILTLEKLDGGGVGVVAVFRPS
jgi:hypothetical protein